MLATFITSWTEMIEFFVSLFQMITGVFWTAAADGGTGEPTFVGLLALITLGISFFTFVMNVIFRAIKFRS